MRTLFETDVKLAVIARIVLLLAGSAAAAFADTVNLTDGPPFNFRSGSDLFVRFSIWNFAVNNASSSPYPTSVGLQLLGARPGSSQLSAVPNSTSRYFNGYSLQGWLENSSGTVSVPFTNPDAIRLSLGAGSLLVEPGTMSSGTPLAVIEADAALTLNLSESIFGPDVASRGSSAVIHLRNVGQDLQIGLNDGYSLLSAFREPSIKGLGGVQTSGITQSITATSVPEPGSFALLVFASSVLGACAFMRWRKTPKDARPRS